jgi:replicative DNA helicase
LQRKRMIVVMGRPGLGKSWLDLLFVANTVVNGGKVVLYPLEMTLFETAMRLYTIFTQRIFGGEKVLKNFDLTQGHISTKKIRRFVSALEDKYAGQLLVADVGSIGDPYTVERIEAETEMNRPDVIWVDYITLMRAPRNDRDNESTAIKSLAEGIKGIAQRQDCVGGASAQVNRDAIKGNHQLPRLEHIMYGDAIGQAADQVIPINRNGNYLYYALVKNRHGPEFGRTRVRFFPNEGVIEESNEQEDDD